MKLIFSLCMLFVMNLAIAQEKGGKVIYSYKKYEKFDLGNLEVQGQLIAPGDISVRERERKRFEMDLFTRRDFDEYIKKDIESLR